MGRNKKHSYEDVTQYNSLEYKQGRARQGKTRQGSHTGTPGIISVRMCEERWDEDSNAGRMGLFNNKIKQRSTKTIPKGKNSRAGRGLLHSQT